LWKARNEGCHEKRQGLWGLSPAYLVTAATDFGNNFKISH